MEKEIFWKFIVNTNQPKKAEKVLGNIIAVLYDIQVLKIEPYWKNEKQYLIELTQKISYSNRSGVANATLKVVTNISNNWQIDTIYNPNMDELELSGITEQNIKITSVIWASFFLQEIT